MRQKRDQDEDTMYMTTPRQLPHSLIPSYASGSLMHVNSISHYTS